MSPFGKSVGTPDTPNGAISTFHQSRQENYGIAH
jgi:hypothetical protein